MTTRAGIWLDQRNAIVVQLSGDGDSETIARFQSEAEKQQRRAGDRPSGTFEPLNVVADDRTDRKFKADLGNFFDEIASQLQSIDSLLILGPGEAKVHFRKHLEAGYRAPKHVAVETADQMTDREIVAKVREFFQPA